MTMWDWLATPDGIRVEHALIVLILAGAGYLTYLSKRQSEQNAKLLNSHLEQHVMDAVEKKNGNS